MPAHITGVYIYIRTEEEEKNNNSLPLKGKISPGKGFLWEIIHQKMGLGIFLGNILKDILTKFASFVIRHK